MFDKLTKGNKITKGKKLTKSNGAEATMRPEKITTAVRMMCEMRQKLEELAVMNGRSLSGEIVFRLRASLEQEKQSAQKQRT
ncbi:Arc family DNA-binding protein [Pseudomonas ekonensis]|nr:Arc family DNA-binding protein [Pseudomonas ekonensis]